ncbi:MAG: hypothetical protein E7Y34_00675, partial [Mycoplasma sp.]|nr:hypothetical protein [Mycoplasma sp.]
MDKKSIKVNDLINIIDNEYPLTNAANWDQHLGLVVWNKKELVSKILICLDVTNELVEDCVKNNIDFIVSYHPFLFCNTLKEEWILYPYKRKIYQKLKKYKISLYTIHTSYDHHPKGASFNLSNLLKINNYCLLDNNYGLLIKERTNTLDLINHLKKTFNLDFLETTFDKHFKIDKYLFLLGSGDPYSIHYTKTKLVITSDI